MRSFNVSASSFNSLLDISIDENPIPTVILRVPYFGKCSSIFARSLSTMISNTYNVKVNVIYCTFKIKSYFSLKCFSPFYLSSYIVYQFDCKNESCTDSYVGYTVRHLFTRAEEHLKVKCNKQSEIKDHVRKCISCKDATYKDFKVKHRCGSETHCKLFEAFTIKKTRPSLNKQLYANGMSKILHIWK